MQHLMQHQKQYHKKRRLSEWNATDAEKRLKEKLMRRSSLRSQGT